MSANVSEAEIVREHVPFSDRGYVHGVTIEGARVWLARNDELVLFDPESDRVVRRLAVPGADTGTTFDGTHLYQLAKNDVLVIDPADGRVVRRFHAPADGTSSGMTWTTGRLFIGQFQQMRIREIDAHTGAILSTRSSDRRVTGVTWMDGALWHAASNDGQPCELRCLAANGSVHERLRVPVEAISGIEATADGAFWCGGERGTLRLVRRRA
jgi:hypothetical protein